MMKKGLSLVVIAAVGLLIISCAAREEKAARADNQGQPITIAAGDFYEACGNWAPGEKVTFKFTSSAPVLFDVHYHDSYAKMYTIEQALAENREGSFVVNTDAVHCCMWKNDNTKDVTLSYELSVGKQ